MSEKRCVICRKRKGISEFYRKPDAKDGLDWACKPCKRKYFRDRYAAKYQKRPIIAEGYKRCSLCKLVLPSKAFGRNAGRRDGRQVYCRECWPKYQRFWRKRLDARFMHTEKIKRQRRSGDRSLKDRARLFTNLAVRYGYLVPKPCEVCGAEKVTPHHTQYERPLDAIQWFCPRHHLEIGHGGRWDRARL
jgi:hypothetical protein